MVPALVVLASFFDSPPSRSVQSSRDFFSSLLGIERSADGVIAVINDEQAVIKALKDLTLEIARKEIRVGSMMSKEDRLALVEKWSDNRKPGVSGEPTTPHIVSYIPSNSTTSPSPYQQPKRFRPRSPDDRKVLIPPAVTINLSSNPRIKRIFIELKKIEVEGFENAVAVLLRVFLELSVDAFLTSKNIQYYDNEKLRSRMEKVATSWETTQTLKKNEIKGWRNAASSHHLFSLNVLHAYVHSQHAIPKKRDLIKTWDEMEIYFKKLWP